MKKIVSYRDTLVDALRYWPTLYLNEDDVLLQLFFRAGSGHAWKNGCLVNIYGPEKVLCPYRADPHTDRLKDREWRETCVSRGFGRIRHPGGRCPGGSWFRTKTGGIGRYLTDECWESSKILQLPNNIQPDWLMAAKRALGMARSYRVRTNKVQKELLKQVAARVKELQDKQRKRDKKYGAKKSA
jgi:hypothetical protein